MTIYFPVTFQRCFKNDLPRTDVSPVKQIWERCQEVALAAIPLFSLYRPFRGPLSMGMSGVRTITHLSQMAMHVKKDEYTEAVYHFFHAALATCAVGLYFLNPIYCFISSSVSDFIINTRHLIEYAKEGEMQKALECLSFMALDLLFLGSICYGSIELTVACMVFQIILDLYFLSKHVYNGEYFEAICHGVMAAGHMRQAVPQLKLLNWKMNHQIEFTGELRQNSRGFVYLDIPDEVLYSLYEVYKDQGVELPPYFGRGMAGAHVSVILGEEMRARGGVNIADLGKKFQFRISNMDIVHPSRSSDRQVYFLTLASPELESVRANHGFAPRIHGHDFHLTFAVTK